MPHFIFRMIGCHAREGEGPTDGGFLFDIPIQREFETRPEAIEFLKGFVTYPITVTGMIVTEMPELQFDACAVRHMPDQGSIEELAAGITARGDSVTEVHGEEQKKFVVYFRRDGHLWDQKLRDYSQEAAVRQVQEFWSAYPDLEILGVEEVR